ncbi:dTDP-4-dehydrorhamnose 3,5-epimerase [Hymenobacter lutimineralis]|uniref:dTDP-4-dehydrorhamnose 3,5-epimerase n=1 Tax=Hymenobacter lutimineralis TaxID=2606448 RepID=A0A5D6VCZ1_9BACT|nr:MULTISPECIES: dTDP-4-dehydrorhamnose 3,5-epimerase [Hymenobacter]QIX61888.1 dTDP-4-dehydrorhamnose 3,5-epimerase [Hymenobacter sp. BT18]TYZ12608.1 dTDP-4-dehydrorhamnose 3,5-epimerase [Hymenobacter lutimineralis]
MEIKYHALAGIIELTPRLFTDARGSFFESFNARRFAEVGIEGDWVQDNQSLSSRGVLRGLHFQRPPYAQAKLLRVASGRVLDVTVDLRRNSPTYGQHLSVELDAERCNMLYVPVGFAHGFLTLADNTRFIYKCSDYYQPSAEGGLRWNDPTLGISWGLEEPVVSEKDEVLPFLRDFESPF